MSYNSIAAMAQDYNLQLRVTACAAAEQKPSPQTWAAEHMWQLAATPLWDAAYDSAIANETQNPGKKENVITDAMILAAVQPMT